MAPIVLGDSYAVTLNDGVIYDFVFSRNITNDFYTVTISIDNTTVLVRKVVSGEDMLGHLSDQGRVFVENADLLETSNTRVILEVDEW